MSSNMSLPAVITGLRAFSAYQTYKAYDKNENTFKKKIYLTSLALLAIAEATKFVAMITGNKLPESASLGMLSLRVFVVGANLVFVSPALWRSQIGRDLTRPVWPQIIILAQVVFSWTIKTDLLEHTKISSVFLGAEMMTRFGTRFLK